MGGRGKERNRVCDLFVGNEEGGREQSWAARVSLALLIY